MGTAIILFLTAVVNLATAWVNYQVSKDKRRLK